MRKACLKYVHYRTFYKRQVTCKTGISILKYSTHFWTESTQGFRYHKLRKHLESSLDRTQNFCNKLLIFRYKNMCQNESLNQSSTVILFTNKGGSTAQRIQSRPIRKKLNAFDNDSMVY